MLDETTQLEEETSDRERENPGKRRGAWLPVLLVAIVGLAIIGWIAFQSRQEIPKAGNDHARHLATTALKTITDEVSRLAYEHSWADRSVQNIETRLNPQWAKDNIGANLHKSYQITFSGVFGPKGEAIIGFRAGRRIFSDPLQKMPKDVRVLVQKARDASMREPIAAVGLIKIDGAIMVAAASAITPRQPTSKQLVRRNRQVLVLWRNLNDGALANLKKKFDLDHYALTQATDAKHQQSFPLMSPSGETIGNLFFALPVKSTSVVDRLLILFAILILLVALVSAYLVYRAQRAATQSEQEMREKTSELLAQEARNEVEDSGRLDTAILATVSHELKTPLNLIIGFSDVLIKKGEDIEAEERQSQLGFIHDAAEQQLEIVNSILDTAKLEAGKMEMDIEEFEFEAVVDDIRVIANELMKENDNHLEIEMTNKIGTLRTDRVKLRQILLNLLGNAAKFTDKGLIRLTAQRVPDEIGSEVELTVSDTGIGMTPAEAGQVFEAFVQADTEANRRYRGTGLGLTVAQQFTQLLGGSIRLTSAPDAGSEFTITLPAEHFPPISIDDEDRVLAEA